MIFNRKQFGDWGEDLAASFLEKQGYKIIERNFRKRYFGEIDIIAKRNGKIIFVEVKSRGSNRMGYPEEAITPWKKRRLYNTAQIFLRNKNCPQAVFEIHGIFIEEKNGGYEIRHLKNILEDFEQ